MTITNYPDNGVIAYADGACRGNPGPGGWGVVLLQGGAVIGEYSGAVPHTTNNQVELTAVLETICRAPPDNPLVIRTDSRNVVGWLAEGWKRKEPTIAALCQRIDVARSGRLPVKFEWVRGHSGNAHNERADWLASEAVEQLQERWKE